MEPSHPGQNQLYNGGAGGQPPPPQQQQQQQQQGYGQQQQQQQQQQGYGQQQQQPPYGQQQGWVQPQQQQQQQYPYQPPMQQQVIVQHPAPGRSTYEAYHAKQSVGLGATQVTVGILLFIFNIVAMVLNAYISFVGHGIWMGIFFILTGSFGIGARNKGKCPIITFMVLSIISAVLCIFLLGLSAGALAYDDNYYGYDYYDDGQYYNGMFFTRGSSSKSSRQQGAIAMDALMLILCFVEAVVAIWSSAICCHAACCCRDQRGAVHASPMTVQYQHGGPHQQVVFIQTSTATGGQQNVMYTPMGAPQQPSVAYYTVPGVTPVGGMQYPASSNAGGAVSAPPAYSPPPYAGPSGGAAGGVHNTQPRSIDSKNGMPPQY